MEKNMSNKSTKCATWNNASTVDEYGPPLNGDEFLAAQVTRNNYFVWYTCKQQRDLQQYLRNDKNPALILGVCATINEDQDEGSAVRDAKWACFDYVNGNKGGRRYVHIFNTRKEARALRRAHPDIVLPPIRVWITR